MLTVNGFSQIKGAQLGLHCSDLLLLSWFVSFKDSKNMRHVHIDGEPFYWINYETASKELPILHLKKDAIYRRLKRLCDARVLKRRTIFEGGNFSYYALDENYVCLISSSSAKPICPDDENQYFDDEDDFEDAGFDGEETNSHDVLMGFDDDQMGFNAGRDDFNPEHFGFDAGHASSDPWYSGFDESDENFEPKYAGFEPNHANFEPKYSSFEPNHANIQPKHSSFDASFDDFEPNHAVSNPSYANKNPKYPASNPSRANIQPNHPVFEPNRTTFEFDQINTKSKNIYSQRDISITSKQYALSELLLSLIYQSNPKFKKPDMNLWCREFDRILNVDDRDYNEVEDLIKWVHLENPFWASQVLCPHSLRKHYDKILARRNFDKNQFAPRGGYDGGRSIHGNNYGANSGYGNNSRYSSNYHGRSKSTIGYSICGPYDLSEFEIV